MADAELQFPPTRGHRKICNGCGAPIAKAHRVFRDLAYCATCYPKEFLRRPCENCGKPARLHRSQDSGLCRSCTRANWHCIRCKRPVTRAALLIDDNPVCKSCRRYFPPFPPKPERKGFRSCSICHKYRRPIKSTEKPICARCAESGRTAEDVARQDRSYWTARVARDLDSIASDLKTSWCHTLYTEFVEQEVVRTDPKRLALRLKLYLEPFRLLENGLPGKDSINPSSLLELFTADDMRRYENVFIFLQKIGISVPNQQQRRDDSEWRRIRQIQNSIDNPDHAELIDSFLRTRYGEGSRISPKTVRGALCAARGLLSLSYGPVPTQNEIEKYLRKSPGQRASLSAFVGFLKAKGEPLNLVPHRRNKSKRNSRELAACIAVLKGTHNFSQLKAAVVGTLIGLLGIPLSEIVKLPRSRILTVNNRYLFSFEGVEIALDPRLTQGLRKYLEKRDEDNFSTFLFPGRDPYHPVSETAITYHFSKWGISTRQLAMDARVFLRHAAGEQLQE